MSNELYNTIARVTDGIYEGTPAYLPRLKCAISEFKLNFSMRFGYFFRYCNWRRCVSRLHSF